MEPCQHQEQLSLHFASFDLTYKVQPGGIALHRFGVLLKHEPQTLHDSWNHEADVECILLQQTSAKQYYCRYLSSPINNTPAGLVFTSTKTLIIALCFHGSIQ